MSRGTIKPPLRTLVMRFTVDQYERLRAESYVRHIPMAEIIREALDRPRIQEDKSGGRRTQGTAPAGETAADRGAQADG